MKKILLLLFAIFLMGICISAVSADDDDGSDDVDSVYVQNMQNLVTGKETQFSEKDIKNAPGLSGKLLVGHCAALNISKEDLNKAKENVEKESGQKKSRNFMNWLGEHPEIGKDIDNQVEQLMDPDSNKPIPQITKKVIRQLETGGKDIKKDADEVTDMWDDIKKRIKKGIHDFATSGLKPKLPHKDPRAL